MVLVIAYGDMIRPSGYRTRVLEQVLRVARHRPVSLLAVQDQVSGADEAELRRELERAGVALTLLYRPAGRWGTALTVMRGIRTALGLVRRLRPSVIHTHNPHAGLLGVAVKSLYGTPLVLDLHGLIGEEFRLLHGVSETSLSYRIRRSLERLCCRRADRGVFVTHAMRDYAAQAYGGPGGVVIPTCTDLTRFRFDPVRSAAIRRELGVEGRLVLVHSGLVGSWQPLDLIVKLFHALHEKDPSAFLLMLTPTPGVDEQLSRAGIAAADRRTLCLAPADVPAYLGAADLGLLLRTDSIVNRVAMPTKFGEYLACGVPVLVSGELPAAAWVKEYHVGAVVQPELPPPLLREALAGIVRQLRGDAEGVRQRCMAVARAHLSWDTYEPLYVNVDDMVVSVT